MRNYTWRQNIRPRASGYKVITSSVQMEVLSGNIKLRKMKQGARGMAERETMECEE